MLEAVTHLLLLRQKDVETVPFVRFSALMQTVDPLEEEKQTVCRLLCGRLLCITQVFVFIFRVCQCSQVPENTQSPECWWDFS